MSFALTDCLRRSLAECRVRLALLWINSALGLVVGSNEAGERSGDCLDGPWARLATIEPMIEIRLWALGLLDSLLFESWPLGRLGCEDAAGS